MSDALVCDQAQTMTLVPDAALRTGHRCCHRQMSSIEVSSSLSTPDSTLALHTCAGCGRHLWERDGVELDRAALLGIVRDRIAEGPAPRVPRSRGHREAPPAQLIRHTVLGQ